MSLSIVITLPDAQGYLYYGSGINGNQEILGDPSRPVIYWGDYQGDEVLIWNYSSNSIVSVRVGAGPISLDLSPDGSSLFVAISGNKSIAVIDVDQVTVEKSIPLDFTPLSLTFRAPDTLYVSSKNDTWVRTIDLASGSVSLSFDAQFHAILEASPDTNELVAVAQWAPGPNVNITRYDLSTLPPTLVVAEDLGICIPSQVVVDWEGDCVFIAAQGLGGFQKRSLSSLELVGWMNTTASTNGIALSQDKKTVYGICTDTWWHLPGGGLLEKWGSMVYVLSAQNLKTLGMKFIPGELGPVTTSVSSDAIFLCSPLQRVDVKLDILPELPPPGSVYGYTPSFVEFTFSDDIFPAFPSAEVNLSVGGLPLEVTQQESSAYRAAIPTSLPNGTCNVTVDIGDLISANWSFSVDPSSQYAVFPLLNLVSPAAGSRVRELPGSVAVTYELIAPEPIGHNISLEFNGLPMIEYTDEWHPNTIYGYVPYDPSMTYGTYTVTAAMSWLGGSHTYSWDFIWGMLPSLVAAFPAPGSTMPVSNRHVEAMLFPGTPAVELNSIVVLVDGVSRAPHSEYIDETHTAISASTERLSPGDHWVHVEVATDLGTYEADWEYTIGSYSTYQYEEDFEIAFPSSWSYSENVEVGGTLCDVRAIGPEYDGVVTNVMVLSSTNWYAQENQYFMLSQVDLAVEHLQAVGVECGIFEPPRFSNVSGHMAVIYSIQWYDQSLVQRQIFVVNQPSHRIWIITLTVHIDEYYGLSPLADYIGEDLVLLSGADELEMMTYDHPAGFTIRVPETWTAEEDRLYEGTRYDLFIQGPVLDDFGVNVLVMTGTDPELREDASYLESQIEKAILDLESSGFNVSLRGQELFMTIANRSAVQFVVDWDDLSVTQKMTMIVSEKSHRYWVIICSSSGDTYPDLNATFDEIITSFEITQESGPTDGLGSMLTIQILGAIAAIAALLSVTIFVWFRRRAKR